MDYSKRIIFREHYKLLYQRNPVDSERVQKPGELICSKAKNEFGPDSVIHIKKNIKSGFIDFPVLMKDGRVVSSIALSNTLRQLRPNTLEYVYIDPELYSKAEKWLNDERENILKKGSEDYERR